MRVAYFAESPADREVIQIFTEAILRKQTQTVLHAGLEHRGWPSVRSVLPAVLKEIHYRTDAEGFVLVVDSNGAPPHLAEHNPPHSPDLFCRLCQLRRIADTALRHVRPRVNAPQLKVSLGLAVPAMEAWLLSNTDNRVSEAAWINGRRAAPRQLPYTTEELKRWLYGHSHPSLAMETEVMKKAATCLGQNLEFLERTFPHGFGAFINDIRSW